MKHAQSNTRELANAIRFLAIDAVNKAKSGHPGAPMGMADIAEVLWRHHLKHNPPMRQLGGRVHALKTLHSFLNARSMGYRGGISSPLSAPDACSRLSAYLS